MASGCLENWEQMSNGLESEFMKKSNSNRKAFAGKKFENKILSLWYHEILNLERLNLILLFKSGIIYMKEKYIMIQTQSSYYRLINLFLI